MEVLYTPIAIDLITPNPLPVLNAKQGDTSRGALITLTAGSALTLTDETVRVFIKKPDGHIVYADCEIENGKVKAAYSYQMVAAAGKAELEIEIDDGSRRLSTPIAILQVMPSNISEDAIESTDEMSALQTMIRNAEAATNDANEAAKNVKDGVSPIISVSDIEGGHRITIKDAEGTKTVDVMDGEDGTSVTVKSVSESTADGGSNVITFSDGKTVTIKNGSKGSKGDKGDNGSDATVTADSIKSALGYTPVDATVVSDLSKENAYYHTYVTPQMFGAVGDGTTDDTVAMQRAFDEVAKNGKYLFIPNGKYKVTAPITVDWSRTSDTSRNFLQKIIGAGSQAFERYYDNTVIVGYNIPAYRGVIELIGSGNTWGTETRIEDLGIECDKSSCDPMSFALMYGDARNFKLSRVKLRGHNTVYARCGSLVDESGNPATTTYEQINVKFEQCDFYTFPDSTRGFAFLPEGVVTGTYATMDNISLDSCMINGIWVVTSVNVLFQSCHVAINNVANKEITTNNVGQLNGYEIDYATGFYVAQAMSAVFQNCYFEDYRRGIQITPTLGNIRNVSILNCYLNPGCNQFDSNNKRINADYGIRINSGQDDKVVRNVLVQNNVFRYVAQATEGPTAFAIADVSNEFANHFVFRDNCTTSTQEVPKVVNTTTSGYDIQNGADSGASVKSMTTSENGKTLTIELTNGKSVTFDTGTSAPVKGVDYFTEAEIEEITGNAAALAKAGLQQIAPPTWVESVDDMTDQSKHYVLLETGSIWAYMKRTVVTPGGTVANFTNLFNEPGAYIKEGYRYSHSSAAFKEASGDCAIIVPIERASTYTIRVRGASLAGSTYYGSCYFGTTNTTFEGSITNNGTDDFNYGTDDNGDIFYNINKPHSGDYEYMVFHVGRDVDVDSLIVTVNEEISYTTTDSSTEIVTGWADTGHYIVQS